MANYGAPPCIILYLYTWVNYKNNKNLNSSEIHMAKSQNLGTQTVPLKVGLWMFISPNMVPSSNIDMAL